MSLKTLTIAEHKKMIDKMNRLQMIRIYRFAHSNHSYFRDKELFKYFINRLDSMGGITSKVSKQVGWDMPVI